MGLRAARSDDRRGAEAQGYATGQFGKNHLGDRNEFLPTVHGFDEFFGNLYHLNAEEEPENPDYPKDPEFKKRFGPRGVLHCWATDKDDATEDPVRPRRQAAHREHRPAHHEAHGDLRRGVHRRGAGLHRPGDKDGKPFFCWFNSTRMHVFTHLKPVVAWQDRPGHLSRRHGRARRARRPAAEEARRTRLADNTIVIYHDRQRRRGFSGPTAATTPFRGEKDTNWEGGLRVPCVIRWPGVIKPGTSQRHLRSRGLDAHASGRGRRARHQVEKL